MTSRAELLSELEATRGLLHEIVHKRKKKILVRWILGAIFYIAFWHIGWIRTLFWIGLVLELTLFAFTVWSYFRLKAKIRDIEEKLDAPLLPLS